MIAAIISLLIFVVYLIFAIRYTRSVPVSLSETYYRLGGKDPGQFNRLRASIFTLMMFAISFLLLPALLEITPEPGQFLLFLALASICFVGAAPEFHEVFENKIHTTAAVFAAFFGISWAVVFAQGIYFLLLSAVLAAMFGIITESIKKCKTFWLEMIAFATVYSSAFFALL